MALIQSKTCEQIVMHYFSNEHDLTEMIQRILGDKFYWIFLVSSGGMMALITIGYFLLTCNTFYHVIDFLVAINGDSGEN